MMQGNPMSEYIKVLTIAGSDSGGGAGIQADLKTFSALGCYGMSVLTALTAQNTLGVSAIHAPSPDFVGAQIDAIYADMGTDAVKIGMVFSAEIAAVIAERMQRYNVQRIVLDPVMVATSGDSLLAPEAVSTLVGALFPLATLITPNLAEAAALTGLPVGSAEEREAVLYALADMGAPAVLLKGGHLDDSEATDCLYERATDEITAFRTSRIDTPHTHGTGCTLSAAIAAGLAKGQNLKTAVANAKTYLTAALQAGAARRLGKGSGPVDHFWEMKR
jgi:hydroxymethylpyrimidine/phosphomethylpyrimidine kinase